MNTQQIRDLAIKILGLYFLSHAIVLLPQIVGTLSFANNSDYVAHKSVFLFASSLPVVLYFVVAYVLLLKTRAVMSRLWPTQDQNVDVGRVVSLSLATWVGLVGLFYLVGSVGGVLAELYILGVKREMLGSYMSFKFIPEIITLILSIICIAKAHAISDYLKRRTEQDTQ